MANLDFLDAKHEVFAKNDTSWAREERRLYGGDPVLTELVKWRNETDAKYTARQAQASWIGFPKTHASILSGHIVANLEVPNYGTLGDVRALEERSGLPTVAELFHFNVDGVGADGSQLQAWLSGILQRAMATGHRWCMVEMPRRAAEPGAPITQADVLAGQRPYLVEYSPRSVTNWEYTNGQLDWCVIRTKVGGSIVRNGVVDPSQSSLGYYLLVRKGFTGLGDDFKNGGWWLYNADKVEQSKGDWSRTKGQIPFLRLTAESSTGTMDWPAISRSLTMELGQIAVSLMNRISERNFDASDAARSVKFLLGADKDVHNLVVDMLEDNAIVVTVMGVQNPQTGVVTVPSIYDSSAGAVAADVFSTIIAGTIAEAQEIMVRQLSSTEDASGRSKEVGFGEATSPLLSTIAANTETFLNSMIYFVELRAGASTPRGFVTLPREFKIAPVLQKIDAAIARMKEIGAQSPTFATELVKAAAQDDGLWLKDQKKAAKVEAELLASLTLARREKQAAVFDTFAKAGTVEGAGDLAELSGAEVKKLSGADAVEPAAPATNGNDNGAGVPVLGGAR